MLQAHTWGGPCKGINSLKHAPYHVGLKLCIKSICPKTKSGFFTHHRRPNRLDLWDQAKTSYIWDQNPNAVILAHTLQETEELLNFKLNTIHTYARRNPFPPMKYRTSTDNIKQDSICTLYLDN